MSFEIGDVLTFFRANKNISQKKFCGEVLNRSYYSKIESGSSNISASILFEILDSNNISIEEFCIKLNSKYKDNIRNEIPNIIYYFYKNNSKKLIEIRNSVSKRSYYYDCINLLVIKLIHGTEDNNVSLINIKNILSGVNEWNIFEIRIYTLCMPFLSNHDLIIFSNSFVKKSQWYIEFNLFEREIDYTYLLLIKNLIDRKLLEEARYYYFIAKNIIDEGLIIDKLILDIFNHIIQIKQKKYKDVDTDFLDIKMMLKIIKTYGVKHKNILVKEGCELIDTNE